MLNCTKFSKYFRTSVLVVFTESYWTSTTLQSSPPRLTAIPWNETDNRQSICIVLSVSWCPGTQSPNCEVMSDFLAFAKSSEHRLRSLDLGSNVSGLDLLHMSVHASEHRAIAHSTESGSKDNIWAHVRIDDLERHHPGYVDRGRKATESFCWRHFQWSPFSNVHQVRITMLSRIDKYFKRVVWIGGSGIDASQRSAQMATNRRNRRTPCKYCRIPWLHTLGISPQPLQHLLPL